MAGRTLTVDMADDDLIPAWQTVIELAAIGIAERLTLVGGLMVADHLPSRMQPRLARRPAFPAPSGEQAIRRRDSYRLIFASGAVAEGGVPDELGALVAKGAAYQVDRRDRERHLDDAAVLLASVGDASVLDYDSMSRNDRRRIAGVSAQLADERHRAWTNLDPPDRGQARFNLALITRSLTAG